MPACYEHPAAEILRKMSMSPTQSSTGQQEAQTMENVLKGERSFQRVEFAVTGVPIADLIAGITAVVAKTTSPLQVSPRGLEYVFEMLSKQYKSVADMQEEQNRRIYPVQSLAPAVGTSGGSPPPQINQPYSGLGTAGLPPLWGHVTTSAHADPVDKPLPSIETLREKMKALGAQVLGRP